MFYKMLQIYLCGDSNILSYYRGFTYFCAQPEFEESQLNFSEL